MERLDKVLANSGVGTRKEVKLIIKAGKISVEGKVEKDNGALVDVNKNTITISGEPLFYKKFIYLLMNKPAGVVSATFDNYDKTVIDLLKKEDAGFMPFPVGRLDKDTVGLLLLTNDGELNHRLISPKYHVDKKYYAELKNEVTKEDTEVFAEGVIIDEDYKCLPAKLEEKDESHKKVYVTIHEGKFHQVKKMFLARNNEVLYLKRICFGPLTLDLKLSEGDYRELSKEEIEKLKKV